MAGELASAEGEKITPGMTAQGDGFPEDREVGDEAAQMVQVERVYR